MSAKVSRSATIFSSMPFVKKKETPIKEGPISLLPNEILLMIFSLLDLRQHVTISMVCKKWKQISSNLVLNPKATWILKKSMDAATGIYTDIFATSNANAQSLFPLSDEKMGIQTTNDFYIFNVQTKESKVIENYNVVLAQTSERLFLGLADSHQADQNVLVCIQKGNGETLFKLKIENELTQEQKLATDISKYANVRFLVICEEKPLSFTTVTSQGLLMYWVVNDTPNCVEQWDILDSLNDSSDLKVECQALLSNSHILFTVQNRNEINGKIQQADTYLHSLNTRQNQKLPVSSQQSEIHIAHSQIFIRERERISCFNLTENSIDPLWSVEGKYDALQVLEHPNKPVIFASQKTIFYELNPLDGKPTQKGDLPSLRTWHANLYGDFLVLFIPCSSTNQKGYVSLSNLNEMGCFSMSPFIKNSFFKDCKLVGNQLFFLHQRGLAEPKSVQNGFSIFAFDKANASNAESDRVFLNYQREHTSNKIIAVTLGILFLLSLCLTIYFAHQSSIYPSIGLGFSAVVLGSSLAYATYRVHKKLGFPDWFLGVLGTIHPWWHQ